MAVDPKIKQKAEDIRKKIFGSEVRESLASGLEGMSEDVESIKGRQDTVETTFQEVIDETTDKDVISAPELIAARNGKSNLKTRLDDEHAQVTAQLQQTEQELSSQLVLKASKKLVDLETKLHTFNIQSGLELWRQRISNPQTNVLLIGDSLGEGYNTVNRETEGYFTLIRNKLNAYLGNGGVGYVPLSKTAKWVLTGTWETFGDYGAFGSCRRATGTANTATITLEGDNFDIHYANQGGSSFTVQVDGGTPQTITTLTNHDALKFNISAGTFGLHTIKITAPTTGYVYLLGVSGNKGTTGTRVHDVSKSGAGIFDMHYSFKENFIDPLTPDLTVIAMIINDFNQQRTLAQFRTAYLEMITKAKTHGSVLLVSTCEVNDLTKTIKQKEYEQVMIDLAKENNCGFISIYDRWTSWDNANNFGFMGDTAHPTTIGHVDLAKTILKEIL